MDSDGLPLVGGGIDFTAVEPIHHRRILAYVNHFVMQTANMLNHWSNTCEEKLVDVDRRIRRLETTMALLETKLASIPS
ncbi:WASH complex subunit 3-like [Sycon ciliatum]|uniref:WASH complex subunit 3-like n=1 Tax=Sycon ciliatum TaxID=27933 RepID=UPI0020AC8EF2